MAKRALRGPVNVLHGPYVLHGPKGVKGPLGL
jgi:hypothetical protein